MLNLFDMLNQSQNGQGVDLLAKQFGLSQEQARQAVEALLPAFSQGLKQNTADPYGVGAFMSALASGQHARYFDNPAAAFTPQGMADGNGILGHLFGSKDLSRAVADQAAQATGIGQDVLKQMLPALAAMIMGGMFKQSTNQMQAGGFPASGNPLGKIIEQMMRHGGGFGGATQPQQRSAPPGSAQDHPFGRVLQDMFGGAGDQQTPGRNAGGPASNPWGKMLEDMLGGGAPRERRVDPDSRPSQRSSPNVKPGNPYEEIFGRMFETGRQQRDDYQKGVESIFDQFSKGMDRYK
jgi:hypothetical protein